MLVTKLILVAVIGQSSSAWNAKSVKSYIMGIELAAGSPDPAARDAALLSVAGQAYQTSKKKHESVESYARRTLKKIDTGHPRVKKGQWLLALTRRFYHDLALRCASLGRFERRKRDKTFFAQKSKEYAAYVTTISGLIRVSVKGVDGEIEALPVGNGSSKEVTGVQVTVTGQNIGIEQAKRITFENHQPPVDANRTARGALMSLYNSFRQHFTYGKLMARSRGIRNKALGKARMFIPATKPAIYLNELLSAAKEAEFKTVYLMVFRPKTGVVAHIDLRLSTPSRKERRRHKYKAVHCRDEESMQLCVEHLNELQSKEHRLYIE